MHIRCPHCHNPIEVVADSTFADVECPACGSSFNLLGQKTTESYRTETRTIAHFELIEQLGVGHFGAIWKATDTKLDRFVAVKIPRKEQLTEAEAEVFLRDVRAAAQLKHSNIVSVFEVGKDDDTLYIAMDYVEGADLKEWLGGEPITPREAAELMIKLADAVQHAHEHGVIHRDLKPGNVMMSRAGEPSIVDFGLAKRESGEITMTVDGATLGTPAYMSPEQARGKAHEADARSDVYSLGVVLFEMLSGTLPFHGEKRMLIVQILEDDPPQLRRLNSQVTRDLETICLRCMEKDPAKRPRSAEFLASELRRCLAGEPIQSRPVSRLEKVVKWCRRNPTTVRGAAAMIGLLLVSAAIFAAARHQNLSEQIATTVSSLNTSRGIILPPLTDLDEFPREMVLAELREQLERAEDDRKLALAYALAHYGDVRVEFLVSQVEGASPDEVDNLLAALGKSETEAVATLEQAAREAEREKKWRHKARLAMLSLRLNVPALAQEMCRLRPDPIQRTWFIEECCAGPATFAFAVYPIKWSSSRGIDGSSSILRVCESEFFDNLDDQLRERHHQRVQLARSTLRIRLTQRDAASRSVDGVALETVRHSV